MEESDKKTYWFPAKKYGFGWGLPITWQGWVVFALYLLIILGASLFLPTTSVIYSLVITVATAILIWITVKTGEPSKWRWGNSRSEK